MTAEKIAPKVPKLPVIPLVLTLILMAAYVFVVLVPAFSKAGGIPADIFSLIGPLVLIVVGLGVLMWARSLINRKVPENK
ncbi:MAG: hypothetical protein ACRECC_04270 [Pseudolabrys sp.]